MKSLDYFPPGPVAAAFSASRARRRVLMGPFGSGKSTACVMDCFQKACLQAPNSEGVRMTRFAVVRNTYPELKHTTFKTWKAWLPSEFGEYIEASPFEHRIRMALPDGTRVHCDVLFLALDQEADTKKMLSLEVTGIWFNEVREIKRSIVEAGDGRVGRYPAMKDGGPTWYGIIADTNMPDEDHWLYGLAEVERPDGWAFFRQPGGIVKQNGKWRSNLDAENRSNLPADYYSGQISGKREEWISVHLAAEYGRLPTEGSYYEDDLTLADRERRVGLFSPSSELPVHTFWDLGVSDDTAIWFGQGSGGQWTWVHYYENRGQSLDHYARYLKELAASRKFTYGNHVWPHDGGHRDPGILGGKSRRDVFEGLGFKTILLPRHNIADGIDAARRLIRVSRFDTAACGAGLKRLRRYRREFDEERNVYKKKPLHDENSHAADAFRTAAMGVGRVSNNNAAWSEDLLAGGGVKVA